MLNYPAKNDVKSWPSVADFGPQKKVMRVLKEMPEALLSVCVPSVRDDAGNIRINPVCIPWLRAFFFPQK